jgi:hypothetical protein
LQTDDAIDGTFNSSGEFLVPDDFIGYLGTVLDYGLLNPLGLAPVLEPVIDLLLGQTPDFP